MKKRIEELKEELESVASSLFYLDMKDHFDREDYETYDKYEEKIKEIIKKLEDLGIKVDYRLGYGIKYELCEK